jgi:integrase
MIGKLTKRAVDALRPQDVDSFFWDSELKGFGVKVTPKARRVFVYQYWTRPPLKRVRRRATIGTFPAITVEQAREAAHRLALRVSNGEDPAGEASAARLSAKDATVAAVSAEFLTESTGKLKPRTRAEYERLFKANIVPALGKKAIADVSLRDVTALHSANRETPSLANHVLTLLGTLLYWAESRGYRARGTNPVRDVEKYPENYRERFLSAEEVGRLGAALTKALERAESRDTPNPADLFAVAAIRFLALTGWRRGEALSLKWSDVDLKRGAATLPHSKTGRSYRAIGAPAVALLASLPRLQGSPYVFPSTMKPGHHLTEVRKTWDYARRGAGLSDVRLHDLRHNVASWAVGGGTSLYLTGALLGHVRAETTQRYAHLQEDARKAAADSVSSEIASALEGKKGAKTIPLRARQ